MSPRLRTRAWALVALTAVLAAGCAADSPARPTEGSGLDVVASTPLLAELAETVTAGAGASPGEDDDAGVRALVPRGADPHRFRLADLEIEEAREADVLLVTGPGFEASFEELVDLGEEPDGPEVFVAVEHLDDPVETAQGDVDPHLWHDPGRTAAVVRSLADTLGALRPERRGEYTARARRAALELDAVRSDVEELLEPVPEQRRALVTQHDFFRWFAAAFGFRIVASIVPGPSPTAEASANSRRAAVEAIGEHGVCAVFAPEAEGGALAESVAREAEGDVRVVEVFADTIGSDTSSHGDLVVENARRVAGALTDCG